MVIFLLKCLGTPFSDCRVDIEGPYQNPNEINTPTRVVIRASESEPAVFYCRYTYHEDYQRYSFRLHIDVLDECGSDDRVEVLQNGTKESVNFTVTRTEIDERNDNNMTTFKAQVYVGSNAPTLLAKCYMQYFPGGYASLQTNCSSSSTFAIINNDTTCTQQPPSTEPPTVTSSTPPPSPTPSPTPTTTPITTPVTDIYSTQPPTIMSDTISAPAFGSIVGVLCAIVAIETLLLMIIFFVKCKKFRGGNDNVVHVRPYHAETHKNVAA